MALKCSDRVVGQRVSLRCRTLRANEGEVTRKARYVWPVITPLLMDSYLPVRLIEKTQGQIRNKELTSCSQHHGIRVRQTCLHLPPEAFQMKPLFHNMQDEHPTFWKM